ncbi:MAG: DNA polymerase domain-containing protein [Clostridium sp.]
MLFYDFEVFKEDWLVVIKDTENRTTHTIVNSPEELTHFYEKNKNSIWVGYNSRSYDQYILKGILLGMSPQEINTHIIVHNQGGWSFSRSFNKVKLYNYDIMTDKFKGLKQLEGFMGNDIRETTVNFNTNRKLTSKEIEEVIFYCNHDVEQTMHVFMNRKSEFESHMSLIKAFDLPLSYINKTKAQLSAIILEASRVHNRDDEFDITIVDTLRLNKYRHILEWYKNPINRDYKKSLDINVGEVPHTFGWGGLHGARAQYQGEGIFINSDVGSFYPALMIEYNFLSRNVRVASKYKEIRDRRLELKKNKDPMQLPYKIVLNSTYGASKDQYNNLYDPLQANNVCVNGQLLLLDLIEHVESQTSFKLIQSNTDGIMFKLNVESDIPVYESICKEWEERSRMTLEHDIIKKVVQKDVNNYIIVMDGGKVKSKGAYVKKLDKLDNDLPIVNQALMDYFIKGIPVDETINESNKLIDFQKVVKVSSKYKKALHGDRVINEKILRVFASKSYLDRGVYKVNSRDTPEKIAGTPERCFIDNSDITNKRISRKLDRSWYIDVAKKRIVDFVGDGIEQMSFM